MQSGGDSGWDERAFRDNFFKLVPAGGDDSVERRRGRCRIRRRSEHGSVRPRFVSRDEHGSDVECTDRRRDKPSGKIQGVCSRTFLRQDDGVDS